MLRIIFFAAFATSLEWWQPDPTLAAQDIVPLDGWTPKPTLFPKLAKRQQIPAQDTICGYVGGDPGRREILKLTDSLTNFCSLCN
jgi:hypothetical protein